MKIKDFKGRLYTVIEERNNNTLLKCCATGHRIKIRSWGWDEIGFVRP